MDTTEIDFYRDPDPQICQGDIFESVPHLHQQWPLRVLRQVTAQRYGEVLQPFGLDAPPADGLRFERGMPEDVPASCLRTRGILLTHGCEIDKDRKYRMVALVKPLGPLPLDDAAIIRAHRNYRYFYLPEDPGRIQEAYVDFRRITSVAPEFFSSDQRIASLTEFGRKQLLMKLVMYLTRISPESLATLILPQ